MNCPTCFVMLDPGEPCPRCAAPGRRATFLATLGALCLGAIVVALGGIAAWQAVSAPAPFQGSWQGDRFVVASEDGGHRYEYEADGGATRVRGIAYFRSEASGIDSFGMSLVVHYLSPEQHAQVQREFGDAGRCPASYYNRYMHQLQMIPMDHQQAIALQGFPFQKFVPFEAEGHFLRFAVGERDGQALRLRDRSKKSRFFQPTTYEIAGERMRLDAPTQ